MGGCRYVRNNPLYRPGGLWLPAAMNRTARPYWIVAGILAVAALWLLVAGRVPICTCGYIKLWHGQTMSSENSQHLTDWYTPSHIIHGILFYAGLWLVARRLNFGWRLVIATVVETAWEIVENSPWIIERYRAVTISLDYYGDSVINSLMDILAMVGGFYLARYVPVWVSVAVVIGFEVLTAWTIRDGLALNVLMLVYPMDWVLQWQAGG